MLKRLLRRAAVQEAAAALLGRYLTFALATTRWTVHGESHLAPHVAGTPAVFAFWHERLPAITALYLLAKRRNPALRMHVLISRHRDGRFIAAIVARLGVSVVHGSSSKGGASGMRQLVDRLAARDLVAITPDGPRGPPRRAAPGTAQIAALAGVPIVPCAAQSTRRRALASWDRMQLPLPFGRGAIVCGAPIAVPRGAWEQTLPALEAAIDTATALADQLCGR